MERARIQRNAPVMATDGEFGRVTHVIADGETREVTEIVVGHEGQEWLVPVSAVQGTRNDTILLRGTRAELETARFDRDAFHAVDDEDAEEQSARRAARGGAPLHKADDDSVIIGGPSEAPNPRGVLPTRAEAGATVRLREEELHARKQTVEAGEVEIRKEVVSEQKTIEVPVTREEVLIERRPVRGRPAAGPVGEGEAIRVPIREEQVTVEKRPVVTEEIEVGKRTVQETRRATDTVRREEAVVDHDEDVDVRHRQAGIPHAEDGRRR